MNEDSQPQPWKPIGISILLAMLLTLLNLPDWLAIMRPALLALVVFYWASTMPDRVGLFFGWSMGLVLDVMTGTLLGQHALAMTVGVYCVIRMHTLLRMFPLWQQSLVLLPVWAIYEFILFWIDGVIGRSADPLWRWAPVLSTTLCWPLVSSTLSPFNESADDA